MSILNFGSLNIDKVYRVSRFVKPGETISAQKYSCFPGGKGLNQSVAVAKAGGMIFHAGTIGSDGEFLREVLKENGVEDSYLRTSDTVTGNALIQVADSGENCIILFGGSNLENTKPITKLESREIKNKALESNDKGDKRLNTALIIVGIVCVSIVIIGLIFIFVFIVIVLVVVSRWVKYMD